MPVSLSASLEDDWQAVRDSSTSVRNRRIEVSLPQQNYPLPPGVCGAAEKLLRDIANSLTLLKTLGNSIHETRQF